MASLGELAPTASLALKTAKHMLLQQVHHMHHASNNQQSRESAALLVLERQRLRSEYSFERAFHRFSAAVSEKRQAFRDAKQHAKDRLRSSVNELLGAPTDARVLSHAEASTSQSSHGAGSAHAHGHGQLHASHAQGTVSAQSATISQQPSSVLTASQQMDQSQMEAMFGSGGFLRHAILSGVATASRAFLTKYHGLEVQGSEHMSAALQRPAGQALITVCNHVSAIDDPLVVANIVPQEYYDKPQSLRWTLCASDRCFKYAALAPLFTAAKVLPVTRGGGLAQTGMRAAEERLAQGDWVHIFPEGTRSRNPERMLPVRKGVGRLVAAAAEGSQHAPLVVPFVHSGMEGVMPVGSSLPAFDGKVRVVVGEPIRVDDLLAAAKVQGWGEDALYVAIAQRVGQRLHTMHATLMAGDAPAAAAAELQAAAQARVSDRDLYDEADLQGSWGPKGLPVWERAAFKMWHRGWAMSGWVSRQAGSVRAAKDAAKARALVSARNARQRLERYGVACAAAIETSPVYLF